MLQKQYLKPFNYLLKEWALARLRMLPTNYLQIIYLIYV